MILLDFQQTIMANLMVGLGNGHHGVEINEGILRHMVLKSIKTIHGKFRSEFGKLVICCDGGEIWRKDVYPYYKANRKKSRDESPLDWKMIFESLNKVRDEIGAFMPYVHVHEPRAEADDVIAVLAQTYASDLTKTLIVSGDGDFVQLHSLPNVRQWNHVKKIFVGGDPVRHLREKIIRGDTGDGVPNFLSDDDTLVTPGKRQKNVMTTKLEEWHKMTPEQICDTDEKKRNWARNETMVDLTKTPESVRAAILDKYKAGQAKNVDRALMREYFVNSGLKELTADLQDF